jgi:hypothetical protein
VIHARKDMRSAAGSSSRSVSEYWVLLMISIECLGLGSSGIGSASGSTIARRCALVPVSEIGKILDLKGLVGPTYLGKTGCSYVNRHTGLTIGISPGTRQKFESIKRRDARDGTSVIFPLGKEFGVGGYYTVQKGPRVWSFAARKRSLTVILVAGDVPLWRGRNLFSVLYKRT